MDVKFWDSKVGQAIRWVGVLPIAIFGMLASRFLWGLWNDIAPDYFDDGSIVKLLIVEGVGSVIAGAAFIFFGNQIAPLKNKLTAIILLVILIVIACFGFFLTLAQDGEYGTSTLTFLGIIIGGVLSCIRSINDEMEAN